jgi:hypothetical protein
MALMARPRRALGVMMLLAVALPALWMPFQRHSTYSAAENRMLAAKPAWPQAPRAWASWPKSVDRYLGDHFAFRERLVQVGNGLFGRLTPPGAPPPVLDGEHGRLFLSEGLLASTGHEVDAKADRDLANFACDMAGRLRAMGARLVFSIPPSPAEIYPEDAPDFALPARSPTNYDLIMNAVRGCDLTAVDLRPTLRAAKGLGQLYHRTDTHWTPMGSLIAYDRIVDAIGRPEFAIPLAKVRWTPTLLTEGDLPRMAGRPPIIEPSIDPDALQPPPSAERTQLSGFVTSRPERQPVSISGGGPGPTVLIIGDSFTEHHYPRYFSHFVRRVVWTHEDDCRFDWNVVRAVKPQIVLFMPTERWARCTGGGRPANYPPR